MSEGKCPGRGMSFPENVASARLPNTFVSDDLGGIVLHMNSPT